MVTFGSPDPSSGLSVGLSLAPSACGMFVLVPAWVSMAARLLQLERPRAQNDSEHSDLEAEWV